MALINCPQCGALVSDQAPQCPKCGTPLKQGIPVNPVTPANQRSKAAAALLAFFLGGLGIHRFYLGYTGIGIAQLLTAGGCGLWALIDFIMILIGSLKAADGTALSN